MVQCGQHPCNKPSASACAGIIAPTEENLLSKGYVVFRPSTQVCPDSGEDWSLDPLGPLETRQDPAIYLLHEIGHPLGLDHADNTEEECHDESSGMAVAAVMHHILGEANPARRDWRRDDIEGIRALWGAEIEHAVYSWQDEVFPQNPEEAARTALCTEMRTPPAVTSTVSEGAVTSTQFVAFTNANDRVTHLHWDGATFAPPTVSAIVDPSPFGILFAPVGIAHSDSGGGGPRRVLVIWTADETISEFSIRLRWALRDIDGGFWTYGFLDTPDVVQRTNDVAAGFDPGNSLFIISSLTDAMNPYFVSMDLQGNPLDTLLLQDANDRPIVFDIGEASCFPEGGVSRCVVPYISSEHDELVPEDRILRSGWYNLEVQPDGVMTLVVDTRVSDFEPRGMVDLSSDIDGFRGAVGDRRYTLDRAPGVGATDTPTLDTETFPSADWPLRVGSQQITTDATTHRILARRLGRLCGNGVVECEEACDDGNVLDGDGCSASCNMEPDPTTGTATTALTADTEGSTVTTASTGMTTAGPATASDTGPVADEDGCGCIVPEGHEFASLPIFVLIALARRRSNYSSHASRSSS